MYITTFVKELVSYIPFLWRSTFKRHSNFSKFIFPSTKTKSRVVACKQFTKLRIKYTKKVIVTRMKLANIHAYLFTSLHPENVEL